MKNINAFFGDSSTVEEELKSTGNQGGMELPNGNQFTESHAPSSDLVAMRQPFSMKLAINEKPADKKTSFISKVAEIEKKYEEKKKLVSNNKIQELKLSFEKRKEIFSLGELREYYYMVFKLSEKFDYKYFLEAVLYDVEKKFLNANGKAHPLDIQPSDDASMIRKKCDNLMLFKKNIEIEHTFALAVMERAADKITDDRRYQLNTMLNGLTFARNNITTVLKKYREKLKELGSNKTSSLGNQSNVALFQKPSELLSVKELIAQTNETVDSGETSQTISDESSHECRM
jgi:hypothetical protein